MDLGGPGADAQTGRDFLDCPSRRQEFKHLAQPRGKIVQSGRILDFHVCHEAALGQVSFELPEAAVCLHPVRDIQRQAANPDITIGSRQGDLKTFHQRRTPSGPNAESSRPLTSPLSRAA